MADVLWVKLYTSFFDNKKVRVLRGRPEGDRIILFYLYLLTRAGQCNDGGKVYFSKTKPYNKYILALEFGCKTQFVEDALRDLSLVEMIEYNDEEIWILDWEKHQNAEALDRIREKERERARKYREKKRVEKEITAGTISALPAAPEKGMQEAETEQPGLIIHTLAAPQGSPAVLMLPLIDGREFPVTQADIDKWQEAYPAADVMQELREMCLWCDANPTKRKTIRGIRKFIINWLSKAQDEAQGMKPSRTSEMPERQFTPTEF